MSGGAAIGEDPAMARFEASTSIERPVEEVYAFLADARNEPAWLSQEADAPLRSELSVELVSGAPGTPGAVHRRVSTRGRHREVVEYRLAEAERPRLLRFERITGKGSTDRTFLSEDVGGATRLTLVQEYTARGPLDRLVSRILLRPGTGRLASEGELARIKSALEERSGDAPPAA